MHRILVSILLSLVLFSCGKKKEYPEDVLLRYGDNYVTVDEITAMIPPGIDPTDSVALFNALVDGWIKDVVLAEFAEERLYDTRAIDRRVKDYRNSLIVLEYLSRMRNSQVPRIDEAKISEYYDRHRAELKLEVPLVKGIFMKINSDAKGKEEIKKLMSSSDLDKIDRLEQNWLDRALEYNYFRDKWVDWETLSGMIPYRFGNPDTFLAENSYFETEYGDCNYYLQISDFLPSGETQPYEFARTWISDILTQGELAEYERILVTSLLEKSIKDKKLEMIGFDPIKHELIKNNVIDRNE